MRLNRMGKISFSVNALAPTVQPYDFAWVLLADNVPMQVQAFPAKWNVGDNSIRASLKTRIFLPTCAFASVSLCFASGVFEYGRVWLIEIVQPDTSGATRFAYVGNITQATDLYLVLEGSEYTGDLTKVA